MSAERSRRLDDILAEALERDPTNRAEYLREACHGDDALLKEAHSLLDVATAAGDFLNTPALEALDHLDGNGSGLSPGDLVGSYRIVRVLGSGGGGTVYEAEQEALRRPVALKMLHARLTSEAAERAFAEEAGHLASLRHPAIAQVYEVGLYETDGLRVPWFAQELVEDAAPITAYARQANLSVRDRMELAARLCDAMHHAHERGIIHRDLKPANVLVSAEGHLKIIDLGIALVEDVEGPQSTTAGTLPYMSPEQVSTGLDVRSDVYALGVLLYEMLSGHVPHDVSRTAYPEAAERIRAEGVRPLGSLDRRLRGEVDAITRKALSRVRERRYGTAAALAADIRHYLANELVNAVPQTIGYRLKKAASRNRVVFAIIGAIVSVALSVAGAGVWVAVRMSREKERADHLSYLAHVTAAEAALSENDVGVAREHLVQAPSAYRNWEWHYLWARLDTSAWTLTWPETVIRDFAVTDDGSLFVAIGSRVWWGPSRLGIWDVSTRRMLHDVALGGVGPGAYTTALKPGGRELAVGTTGGSVEIWDLQPPRLRRTFAAHQEMVNDVAYDPSGTVLATASRDRTVRLWQGGELHRTLEGHLDRVVCLAFDADGRRLAAGDRAGTIRIWDVATGETTKQLRGHVESVEGVAWTADGARLISCSVDTTVRLWDVEAERAMAVRRTHDHLVREVVCSPDGKTAVSASWDRTLRVWDTHTCESLATLRGHVGGLSGVAFLPSGVIVSAGLIEQIKGWRADDARHRTVLFGHTDIPLAAAFSPDGRLLASSGRDRAVRIWDPTTRRPIMRLGDAARYSVEFVAFTPDSARVVAVSQDGTGWVWSLPDGQLLHELPREPSDPPSYLAALNEHQLTVCSVWGGLRIWDTAAGTLKRYVAPQRANLPRPEHVSAFAIDSLGRWQAWGDGVGNIRVGHTGSTVAQVHRKVHLRQVRDLAFSPNGRYLASASLDRRLKLLDARTLEEVWSARCPGFLYTVAFSADGARVLAGGSGRTLRMWDAETGQRVAVLKGPRRSVRALAVDRNGRWIASTEGTVGYADGVVRLWDAPGVR